MSRSPTSRLYKALREAASDPERPENLPEETVALLAERLGVRVLPVPSERPDWYYNGKGRIFVNPRDWSSDGYHEMSHYQMCSPHRRKQPEYGLGAAAQGETEGDSQELLDLSASGKEEEHASMLGVYYEWFYGANPGHTLCNHNWIDQEWRNKDTFETVNHPASILNELRWLITNGFINEDLTPSFKLRDWEDKQKDYGRDSNEKDVDGSGCNVW